MQKIVREYSKIAWTDKDMIEFANIAISKGKNNNRVAFNAHDVDKFR